MQVDLHERVALVTGAGRHIGRTIADNFAANGATVFYTDIDEAAARDAASHSPCASADRAHAFRMNVTDEESIQSVIEDVVRRHGRLDILVNNAGVNTAAHRVTIEEFPRSEWDRLIQVDLTGVFLVSKAVAAVMVARGGGKIINISSVLGLVPARLQCAFTAAKAGVVNLTRAMAIELGARGVQVNCVAPGSVLTEGTQQLFYGPGGQFSDRVKQMLAHIPMGRPGSCDEIANAVLFLAAPESSYITGQTLAVDGGWTAGYLRDF